MDPLYGQRTTLTKNENKSDWIIVNAEDQILGRLCTQIASRLMGKHLSDYHPASDKGNSVIIINAAKVKVTGQKLEQKKYYWHTGYLGGIRERTMKKQMQLSPEKVFLKTLKGMLPKNRLAHKLITRVRVFDDATHNLEAQNPQEIKFNI